MTTLPKIDFEKHDYPLRILLMGNEDTWGSMLKVIQDLISEQLTYQYPNLKQRSIGEIVNHALDSQYGFYTKHLVLGEETPAPLYKNLPQDAKEAQHQIVDTYAKTIELWKSLAVADFQKEIHTEWGQTLTGELTLFQSITHTHYHVSEICFLRGLAGFPTDVMG